MISNAYPQTSLEASEPTVLNGTFAPGLSFVTASIEVVSLEFDDGDGEIEMVFEQSSDGSNWSVVGVPVGAPSVGHYAFGPTGAFGCPNFRLKLALVESALRAVVSVRFNQWEKVR